MSNWVPFFLEAIRADQNASDNTVMAYARDLTAFEEFLGTRKLTFETASRANIDAYLIGLLDQGLANSTRARRLSSIRQLYRFAFEEGLCENNPAAQIRGPKREKSLPKVLSEDTVERLLISAGETGRSKHEKIRNACLMQILYATGMRVSELVSLPVSAVRGDPEMILVKGKGGKERMVPLSSAAKLAIAVYLPSRDKIEELAATKGQIASKFLFPSNGKLGHLTRIRFYTLIKEISMQAGVDPSSVTPHVLRHAFATHLLAGGADLRIIQILLGHADVATTEIYTHVLDEKLKELVLNHHPLA
jgi:integrase/recombinase XerD